MTYDEILTLYSDYVEAHPFSIAIYGDKVGIEPIFDPDKSKGGIIIPDIAKGRSAQGIVKAIGHEVENVKIGDYVLFSGYDGDLYQVDDQLMIVMPESQVQAHLIPSQLITVEGIEYTLEALTSLIASQLTPVAFVHNKLESRTRG